MSPADLDSLSIRVPRPPNVSPRTAVNRSPRDWAIEHAGAHRNGETHMSALLRQIDGRTKLAGNNKLEILLFSLGTERSQRST